MSLSRADRQVLERIVRERRGFGHREHLELTWSYLRSYPFARAASAAAAAIRHVAGLHGAPDRYHDTMTRAWVRLVAVHMQQADAACFDDFLAKNPGLLDRDLLAGHYSRVLLNSASARARFAEPDLRVLPASVV